MALQHFRLLYISFLIDFLHLLLCITDKNTDFEQFLLIFDSFWLFLCLFLVFLTIFGHGNMIYGSKNVLDIILYYFQVIPHTYYGSM